MSGKFCTYGVSSWKCVFVPTLAQKMWRLCPASMNVKTDLYDSSENCLRLSNCVEVPSQFLFDVLPFYSSLLFNGSHCLCSGVCHLRSTWLNESLDHGRYLDLCWKKIKISELVGRFAALVCVTLQSLASICKIVE